MDRKGFKQRGRELGLSKGHFVPGGKRARLNSRKRKNGEKITRKILYPYLVGKKRSRVNTKADAQRSMNCARGSHVGNPFRSREERLGTNN